MFSFYTLHGPFGERYRLLGASAFACDKSAPRHLKFSNQKEALQFLEHLITPEDFWQSVSQEYPHIPFCPKSNRHKQLVANLLVNGQLRIFLLEPHESDNSPLRTIKSNVGRVLHFEPSSTQFGLRRGTKQPNISSQQIFEALNASNMKENDLAELAKNLTIPLPKSQLSRQKIIEAIVESVEQKKINVFENAPLKPSKKPTNAMSSSDRGPGDRIVALAPESPPEAAQKTWFELHIVDEAAEALEGVKVQLHNGSVEHQLISDADGKIRVDGCENPTASVTIDDFETLQNILSERWVKPRVIKKPAVKVLKEHRYNTAIPELSLIKEKQQALVLTPPLGKILMELQDKSGQHHQNVDYSIEGPQNFSGTTDAQGILSHESVYSGQYTLQFTLTHFANTDYELKETLSAAALVQREDSNTAQRRQLGFIPRAKRKTLHGNLFNQNKCFVLPKGIPYLIDLQRDIVQQNPCKALIATHAQQDIEEQADALSQHRAEVLKAFFERDVDTWLKYYEQQSWGEREDLQMIQNTSDYPTRPINQCPIKWYQGTRDLKVDGIAGPNTRRKLIGEYMEQHLENSRQPDLHIYYDISACADKYPLNSLPADLDPESPNADRRVDIFIFDHHYGVYPEKGQLGGKEYPAWIERSTPAEHIYVPESVFEVPIIEFSDINFSTDREVLLPDPHPHEGSGLTANSAIKLALEFVEAQRRHGKTKLLLIAGHTDTVGSDAANLALSERRAENIHLYLSGQRQAWATHSSNNAEAVDYQEVLNWAHKNKHWDCDPGPIDNIFGPLSQAALLSFKQNYNAEFAGSLTEDGQRRQEDWMAVFDLYDQKLSISMAVTQERLAEMRQQIKYAPQKTLACGEHQPLDQPGRDKFESKTNRRVDLLFFDAEELPDLTAEPPGEDIYNNDGLKPVPIPKKLPLIDAFFAKAGGFDVEAHNLLVPGGTYIDIGWRVKRCQSIKILFMNLDGRVTELDTSAAGAVAYNENVSDYSMTLEVTEAGDLAISAANEYGISHCFRTIALNMIDAGLAGSGSHAGEDSIIIGSL